MKWDIAERVEDAFVAYLASVLPGTMRVYAAYGFDAPQFPCAVVFAESSAPVSENATWHDARMVAVKVAVRVEVASEIDGSAVTVATVRERNAAARSAALESLGTTALLTNLIATQTAAVAFSQAQLTSEARSTDGRVVETVYAVDVIAEPVEGT